MHVEALIDLALIGRFIVELGEAHIIIAAITVGKSQACPKRDLSADNAMAP